MTIFKNAFRSNSRNRAPKWSPDRRKEYKSPFRRLLKRPVKYSRTDGSVVGVLSKVGITGARLSGGMLMRRNMRAPLVYS